MTWAPIAKATPFVWTVPCRSDNFAYVIVDPASKEAAVVDGVDVEQVCKVLAEQNATLKFILTTHHHEDHSGGNEALQKQFPAAKQVKEAAVDPILLGKRLAFDVICTPVHTMDHVCYSFKDLEGKEPPFVFTGDFLFRCGCGYFFEGTPREFNHSVKNLYDFCDVNKTLMFYGHEYCESNLRFARHFEPENKELEELQTRIEAMLPRTKRTPTTLKEELDLNPFVRAVLRPASISTAHRTAAGTAQPLCGYVRKMKNEFK